MSGTAKRNTPKQGDRMEHRLRAEYVDATIRRYDELGIFRVVEEDYRYDGVGFGVTCHMTVERVLPTDAAYPEPAWVPTVKKEQQLTEAYLRSHAGLYESLMSDIVPKIEKVTQEVANAGPSKSVSTQPSTT